MRIFGLMAFWGMELHVVTVSDDIILNNILIHMDIGHDIFKSDEYRNDHAECHLCGRVQYALIW